MSEVLDTDKHIIGIGNATSLLYAGALVSGGASCLQLRACVSASRWSSAAVLKSFLTVAPCQGLHPPVASLSFDNIRSWISFNILFIHSKKAT